MSEPTPTPIEDTTMYIRREEFMVEFFAYETIGTTIECSMPQQGENLEDAQGEKGEAGKEAESPAAISIPFDKLPKSMCIVLSAKE